MVFLCLNHRFGSSASPAVVTLSRRQFETGSLQELAQQLSHLKLEFRNDIYSKVSVVIRDSSGGEDA